MEADWDEVAIIGIPPPGPHALPTPVATLAFDTSQELLWAGNDFVSDVLPPFSEVAKWGIGDKSGISFGCWSGDHAYMRSADMR